MTDTRCPICGRDSCPSAADPQTGPFTLHNAAAWADLLGRRQPPADTTGPPPDGDVA